MTKIFKVNATWKISLFVFAGEINYIVLYCNVNYLSLYFMDVIFGTIIN